MRGLDGIFAGEGRRSKIDPECADRVRKLVGAEPVAEETDELFLAGLSEREPVADEPIDEAL